MSVVLAVESEETLAGLRARWVRFEERGVDVLLVSGEGRLWIPAVPVTWAEDRDLAVAEAVGTEVSEVEQWHRGALLLAAALGLLWEDLSLRVVEAQLTLVLALEERTLETLRGLDVERVVELRRTCPRPAQVVRALRAMGEYGARTQ